jgi:hypothetical protein
MTGGPFFHLLKRVTRWASSDAGDLIQIETVAADGSQVILRVATRTRQDSRKQ